MRKWVCMVMMLVMTVAMLAPLASHASTSHPHAMHTLKSPPHHAHASPRCDHDANRGTHDHQTSHDKPCCDKGPCACRGGHCHGGLTLMLVKDGTAFLTSDAHPAAFITADRLNASVPRARLKRPPKA